MSTAGEPEATFPRLFARQVEQTPHAPAVRYAPRPGVWEELDYARLDAETNRVARALIERGAGPETLVAVAQPRHPDLVVGLIAVLKAGAACVPLDLSYPPGRLATLLAAGAGLLLTGDYGAERLDGRHHIPTLRSDRLLTADTSDSPITDADRCFPLRPEHPAYVIYTSGSTGRPKGVVTTHRGIADLARAQREHLAVGAGHRVLQYASPCFDAAIWELCLALLSGATLVMAPAPDLRPGVGLGGVVTGQRITHLTLTPSALDLISDATELDGVRTLVVAGERALPSVVRNWAGGRTLVNAYGPSESTVCATISEALEPGATAVPIGRPIRGTTAYVLGEGLEEVPPGVTGELYLAGAGLARGYLDGPAVTAERFVAHPYGPSGTRMYRTGDLAHWDGEGRLHFDGRTDDQIKLHGSRVEPGEIEAVLAAHPDVRAAAVSVGTGPGGLQVVGHVVAGPAGTPGSAELRSWLAERLPGYLVPVLVREITELPLTPSGKLDRAALDADRRHVLPDPLEAGSRTSLLCALAAEVLGMAEVRPDDGFFDLGGTSMDAVALTGRINEVLGVDVAVGTVFEQQTMAGVDRAIDQPPRRSPNPSEPEPADGEPEFAADSGTAQFDHGHLLRGLFPGRTPFTRTET